jgi:hypothetical protein
MVGSHSIIFMQLFLPPSKGPKNIKSVERTAAMFVGDRVVECDFGLSSRPSIWPERKKKKFAIAETRGLLSLSLLL